MQKHVELTYDGKTLRGMLHTPEGVAGKVPGVILFHGFTGNKMEAHFLFVKLSRALEKAGITSTRFDFYGSGESDGEFREMTPHSELMDAKAILNYFKNIDLVDKNRIGICGLSMGGYIGGITAGDNKDDVKALCLWAPAGRIKNTFENCISQREEIGKDLFDIGGLILNAAARDSAASIDHIKRTVAFDKDTCIIHGTGDQSVPYEVGLKYRDSMKRVEFHPIEGADHTYSKVSFEKEVMGITVDFFERVL